MRNRTPAAVAAASALLAVVAVLIRADIAGSASAAGLGSRWYGAAPYYHTLDPRAPDLGQVMLATGQKAFELAFVQAPAGGGCVPTWDGTDPVSGDTQVAALTKEVRAHGGDVSVSAGGYAGVKLGQTCGTPAATAAAYESVIRIYDVHAIDFDIEEPEIGNSKANANELGAAQILQRENPGLYVSVTIPAIDSGVGWSGRQLLGAARKIGFTPDNYTIMPFDGSFTSAASQITALADFNAQLTKIFGWSSSAAYRHEGVSLMNGRTDKGEYFYQSDFQAVLSFAESHHMRRYTFWSVNRDRQCTAGEAGATSSECSGVAETPYAFTRFTEQFARSVSPLSELFG